MRDIIEGLLGGLLLAAFIALLMLPVGAEPQPLIHYEQIHVMEPWEDLGTIAQKYYKEQKEYESLPQFVTAIRLAKGMDHVYQAGDRLVIPMSRVKN